MKIRTRLPDCPRGLPNLSLLSLFPSLSFSLSLSLSLSPPLYLSPFLPLSISLSLAPSFNLWVSLADYVRLGLLLVLIEAGMKDRPMSVRPTDTLETFLKAVTNELVSEVRADGYKIDALPEGNAGASSSNVVVTPLLGSCPLHADPPFAWMPVYFYMYIYIYRHICIYTHILYPCIFYFRPMYAITVATLNARGDPLECV